MGCRHHPTARKAMPSRPTGMDMSVVMPGLPIAAPDPLAVSLGGSETAGLKLAALVLDEVVGPDLIGPLGSQAHARTVRQSSRSRFSCLAGTFSPSRRQIRSTRLRLTCQPACRGSAAIRR